MKVGHEHRVNDTILLAALTAVTSSGNGTGVNIAAYTGVLAATLVSAAGGGTTPTLDVKIQESDDDSTYSDVAGGAFTQITDAAAGLQTLYLDTRRAQEIRPRRRHGRGNVADVRPNGDRTGAATGRVVPDERTHQSPVDDDGERRTARGGHGLRRVSVGCAIVDRAGESGASRRRTT